MDEELPFAEITVSKTVITRVGLPAIDLDDPKVQALSEEMAERSRVMCDAMFKAMITALPEWKPNPIKYEGFAIGWHERSGAYVRMSPHGSLYNGT